MLQSCPPHLLGTHMAKSSWYFDPDEPASDDIDAAQSLTKYNVSAAPNDFNVATIFNYMEKGVIQIPPFQRNYVWDKKRASRLIESLVMGLPIPQVFLYERSRNQFQVIDGQQRLLTIYFFLKGRFPVPSARARLRRELRSDAMVPNEILKSNEFFEPFSLVLPMESAEQIHPLEGKTYANLREEAQTELGLRTMRVVVVKQNAPKGDGAIYEIFNRLNSGGVNLTAQEIRFSLYYSPCLERLTALNDDPRWRRLLGQAEPDVHFRDVEFLLRGIALLAGGKNYKPSMARFLNAFAHKAESFPKSRVVYFEALINSFFDACKDLPHDAFYGKMNKFTVSIFDSVFAAWCGPAFKRKSTKLRPLSTEKLRQLKKNKAFVAVAQARTTGAGNVRDRLSIARKVLGA